MNKMMYRISAVLHKKLRHDENLKCMGTMLNNLVILATVHTSWITGDLVEILRFFFERFWPYIIICDVYHFCFINMNFHCSTK